MTTVISGSTPDAVIKANLEAEMARVAEAIQERQELAAAKAAVHKTG